MVNSAETHFSVKDVLCFVSSNLQLRPITTKLRSWRQSSEMSPSQRGPGTQSQGPHSSPASVGILQAMSPALFLQPTARDCPQNCSRSCSLHTVHRRLRRVTLILNLAGMQLQAHGPSSSQMKPAPSHWLATNKAALAAAVPGLAAVPEIRHLGCEEIPRTRAAGGDLSDESSASRGQKSSTGDLAGRPRTLVYVT